MTSEAGRRLWEELTPVPTRRNSVRFVTTYAGWDGESDLLWELYKLGVGPEEHPEGQGERLHPTLPIYGNRLARLLVYWDHEARMPWQTAAYYDAQCRTLRPGTYARLHENRWTSAESAFITAEAWDQCVEPSWSPLEPTREHPIWIGVDASTKRDSTAVVGVLRDQVDELVVVAFHRIWQPSPERPLDLEAVEAYLLDLSRQYDVRTILCDPYQLHGTMGRLRARGVVVEEFPQTEDRLTRVGQTLFDLIRQRRLVVYPADALRAHALAATAKETPHGFRIVKTVASRKIDLAIALGMAAHAAVTAPTWSSAGPMLVHLG